MDQLIMRWKNDGGGVQALVFAGGSGNPPLDGDGVASCHMAGYRAVRSDRKERGRDILERM